MAVNIPNLRPLTDKSVREDVEFLLDTGSSLEEVARRCKVGLEALRKAGYRAKVVL